MDGRVAVGGTIYLIDGTSINAAAFGKVYIDTPCINGFTQHPPYFVVDTNGFVNLGSVALQQGLMDYSVDIFSAFPGRMGFAQLINRNVKTGGTKDGSTSGKYWLDSSFPYQPGGDVLVPFQGAGYQPLTLTDSPNVEKTLVNTWYRLSCLNTITRISDQFNDYVMFRPEGPSNIWVTLGTISWGWSATTYWNVFNGWSPVTQSETPPQQWPTESDEFPLWEQIHQ